MKIRDIFMNIYHFVLLKCQAWVIFSQGAPASTDCIERLSRAPAD